MRNLERELRQAWREARAENTARLAGCSFKFNGRFKTKLGCCKSSRATGLPVSVELATMLLEPGMEEQAWDTFYHEVAHALVGHAAGHGPEWKAACRKLGARPERLAALTTEQRQIVAQVNPHKWEIGCEACGTSAKRHVLKQAVKQYGACNQCGGRVYWTDKRTLETGYSSPAPRLDPTNPFGW